MKKVLWLLILFGLMSVGSLANAQYVDDDGIAGAVWSSPGQEAEIDHYVLTYTYTLDGVLNTLTVETPKTTDSSIVLPQLNDYAVYTVFSVGIDHYGVRDTSATSTSDTLWFWESTGLNPPVVGVGWQ